ncbi:hypothetical protein DS2_15434 [Catenovulum agarivorans DS-2]|uniref:DNA replication terminus site-binding protein n=1 Tax=Catenovulum agarivorans DS-2 TaxID=1328313 RepID=W7Q7T9_9ALTE|nr:DNA replication terminus site-binding protein [Catenovulum agarivorans]EWH08864.1 hypothetical protein DS2_15434 [Catenovulum agarivorans DS-2]
MEHIIVVQRLYAELVQLIVEFKNILLKNRKNIRSIAYKLGPVCSLSKSPSSYELKDNLEDILSAFEHFEIEAGANAKLVIRYPGIIAINCEATFNKVIRFVNRINEHKKLLHNYIADNGKPTYVSDGVGQSNYVKNDLLFNALPMKNHLMMTRHIDHEIDSHSCASFTWNVDFIHRKITDVEGLIAKLNNKMFEPKMDLTNKQWQQEIEKTIAKIESYANNNTELRTIDPKPVEPMVFFAGSKKRIKCKLPVIVKTDGEFKFRKLLAPPPKHPLVIKEGRARNYKRLSEHFYLYACT